MDKIGAVINRHHPHATRHAGLNFLNASLDALNHIESIAPLAHDDDPRHSLPTPIEIDCAAADVRTEYDTAHILDANRCSILRGEDRFFQVAGRSHIALAANHVLGAT